MSSDHLARIEAWLAEHDTTLDLADPADPAAIAKAEEELGFALPPSYRDFLLLHDGQKSERVSWLPCGGRFQSIAACVKEWRSQQRAYEPSNPVVPEAKHGRYFELVFHPRWLPIAGNEFWDGDNVVLDMYPAEHGKQGQLVAFVTECDVILIGDSLEGFLARYVELIDAGALVCVPIAGQSYEHEVAPADYASRSVYQTRWEKLFEPLKPVKRPRKKRA
jgi:cell wall assembly regulator SMI1